MEKTLIPHIIFTLARICTGFFIFGQSCQLNEVSINVNPGNVSGAANRHCVHDCNLHQRSFPTVMQLVQI